MVVRIGRHTTVGRTRGASFKILRAVRGGLAPVVGWAPVCAGKGVQDCAELCIASAFEARLIFEQTKPIYRVKSMS